MELVGSVRRWANGVAPSSLWALAPGLALIISASQLDAILGLSISADYFFGVLRELVSQIGMIDWLTAAVSAALLAPVLVLRRLAPTFPGSLLAVVIAGVASASLDLRSRGLAVVGDVTSGFFPTVGTGVRAFQEREGT